MTTRPRGLRRVLAVALAVALGVGMSVSALAQERGDRGRGGRGYERGYTRGAAAAAYGRGGYSGPVYAPAPYARGGGPRSPYADAPPRPYPYEGDPERWRPGYAAPRYEAPYGRAPPSGAAGFRRGQILPPAYAGEVVADPRTYRLRRPPTGYGWVRAGPNAYLVQRSTGMILDTAPLY